MKYCIIVMVWNGKSFDRHYGPFNSFSELYARWDADKLQLEQEYYTQHSDTELIYTGRWKCWVHQVSI